MLRLLLLTILFYSCSVHAVIPEQTSILENAIIKSLRARDVSTANRLIKHINVRNQWFEDKGDALNQRHIIVNVAAQRVYMIDDGEIVFMIRWLLGNQVWKPPYLMMSLRIL